MKRYGYGDVIKLEEATARSQGVAHLQSPPDHGHRLEGKKIETSRSVFPSIGNSAAQVPSARLLRGSAARTSSASTQPTRTRSSATISPRFPRGDATGAEDDEGRKMALAKPERFGGPRDHRRRT